MIHQKKYQLVIGVIVLAIALTGIGVQYVGAIGPDDADVHKLEYEETTFRGWANPPPPPLPPAPPPTAPPPQQDEDSA
ncbi:MAG: hypothetical protein JSV32_02415 [Dehalococcoidia bacterium]|nr:MAG: hypothetical protein JSV32_02415 [Dehalococcoidia bacterium]